MPPTEDRWLSERFGHPVWSVSAGPLDGDGSYQAKVPARNVSAVRELCAAGMYVVDTNLTLARLPDEVEAPGAATVDLVAPGQEEAAVDLAGRSFRFSRFHLDPLVPDEIANRIKRDWIQSYVDGNRGDHLLVAEQDGEVVGLLAVLIREDGTPAIDLVAVTPEHQGEGIGRDLVARFLADAAGNPRVEVGTQAANEPSMRLYERLGFELAASTLVLHGHVGVFGA